MPKNYRDIIAGVVEAEWTSHFLDDVAHDDEAYEPPVFADFYDTVDKIEDALKDQGFEIVHQSEFVTEA